MTTYFVTVGMSMLTSSRCWNGLDGLDVLSPSQLRDPLEIGKTPALFLKAEGIRTGLIKSLNNHDQFAPQAEKFIKEHQSRLERAWKFFPSLLPAELATLNRLARVFRAQDHVLLLHGSGDNEKVAYILKAILESWVSSNLLERITISLPDSPFDWDPTQQEPYKAAFEELWRTITPGFQEDNTAAFVLTGAYKAILMDLVVKICGTRLATKIYYLHEDGTELICTKIEVPRNAPGDNTSPVTATTSVLQFHSVENEPE